MNIANESRFITGLVVSDLYLCLGIDLLPDLASHVESQATVASLLFVGGSHAGGWPG
jgi:hypothetical protein